MKKYVILGILFVMESCITKTNKNVGIKYPILEYYQQKYPNYVTVFDTIKNNKVYLKHYNENYSKVEELEFDSTKILSRYTFYNTVLNKPRYTLLYSSEGKILQDEGKPIYLTSDFFNKPIGKDSFIVFIHLATPPDFVSIDSIYEIEEDNHIYVAGDTISDDHFVGFVGSLDNKNKKQYCIVSNLINVREKNWIRTDTAYFSIIR